MEFKTISSRWMGNPVISEDVLNELKKQLTYLITILYSVLNDKNNIKKKFMNAWII